MAVMYKIVEGEVPKLPEKFSSELNNVLKLWVLEQCIVNFEYTDQTPDHLVNLLYYTIYRHYHLWMISVHSVRKNYFRNQLYGTLNVSCDFWKYFLLGYPQTNLWAVTWGAISIWFKRHFNQCIYEEIHECINTWCYCCFICTVHISINMIKKI